ncbi:hypothetical protein CU669_19610 [Paramagnetospirillum kuznetsovii]|uniref:Helix-turn-helix domain-containing protein n=1 Tax=Paramagnetospirillum kuznetsovii TaxID=2053833 RepID=A0A364NT00_9PROT|nr:helix-turn-helix domain-containing protein [Paramagnetospirillum kuznetsovii]RAU20194.1 hypothetical protein CU669_19610 [Paramagnetospirillum kuznetsovii]
MPIRIVVGKRDTPSPETAPTVPSEPYHPRDAADLNLRSVTDVAVQFGVTPRTIRNWINAHELRAYQIKRRFWINDNDVAEFLAIRRRLQ